MKICQTIIFLVLLALYTNLAGCANSPKSATQNDAHNNFKATTVDANDSILSSSATKRETVRIDGAVIKSVEKWVSKAQKMHVRFDLIIDGKTYAAIIYEGDWNSSTLAALRSGNATLTGYWDTFQDQISFVARKAE